MSRKQWRDWVSPDIEYLELCPGYRSGPTELAVGLNHQIEQEHQHEPDHRQDGLDRRLRRDLPRGPPCPRGRRHGDGAPRPTTCRSAHGARTSQHRAKSASAICVARSSSPTPGHGRSVMSSVIGAICADAGVVPRVRHEVEETSTLVTLVAAGLGVAIVPDPTSALDVAGVCYRPLIPDTLGVDLFAARAGLANSPLIENVLVILRRVAQPDAQSRPTYRHSNNPPPL